MAENRLAPRGLDIWVGIGSSTGSSGLNRGWMCSTQIRNQPIARVRAKAANNAPTYFPSKNWRRVTGLLITVIAVRPSISSLIEMLVISTPNATGASIATSKQICFIIL